MTISQLKQSFFLSYNYFITDHENYSILVCQYHTSCRLTFQLEIGIDMQMRAMICWSQTLSSGQFEECQRILLILTFYMHELDLHSTTTDFEDTFIDFRIVLGWGMFVLLLYMFLTVINWGNISHAEFVHAWSVWCCHIVRPS